MKKIVCLDPGHGGKDAGAVFGMRSEKDDTLRLVLKVKELLSKKDIEVITTRSLDQYVSLIDRTNYANKSKADLFVSIHRNSFTNSSANGVEVWIYPTPLAGTLSAAQTMLEALVKVGAQSNRGIKKGNYHVCRESKMPSMLVELGFISNFKDNDLFDERFNAYALAIAKSICESLNVKWDNEQPKQYARIQIGAYTYPQNESGARQSLEKIRKLGEDLNIPELKNAFLVIPSNERVELE